MNDHLPRRSMTFTQAGRELREAARLAALPIREQLIRSIEFELERAKHGLGMPLDADKVARLEAALEKAKAQQEQVDAAE